jgi:hypothetical protein
MEINFLKATPVEHEINGEMVNFWPLSLAVAFELRSLSGPISSALATLFSDSGGDRGWTERTFEEKDGTSGKVTEAEATPIATIQFRMEAKAAAIKESFECLTDPKNGLVVGKILLDSMRDYGRDLSAKRCQEFVNDQDLDIITLRQLLTGVVQANKKVFGPLADRVASTVGATLRMVPDLVSPEATGNI